MLQEDKTPAHQLFAEVLAQHTGSAAATVMLLTSLDNTDILSSQSQK